MPHTTPHAVPAIESTAKIKTLLVEGWRGVNHSFALANQHQLLEMLSFEQIRLFHTDLPFAFPHWNRSNNAAGFSPGQMQQIDAVPGPGHKQVDCVYRIVSPFRAPALDARKTVTFMITELGLSRASFAAGAESSGFFTRDDNSIVTSTAWSRDRIIEWGYQPDKITVIPLGVDTATFRPIDNAVRDANRAALGIKDDEFVFMNIGIPAWNKGIDLLLVAFGVLRTQGRRVRLILKDQRDVYGVSVEQAIKAAAEKHPALFQEQTTSAISVISSNMSRNQLRLLYGISDCYVSPYRAEGFNLPVLEAIACGIPVVVTKGGATDEFCCDDVALRVEGRFCRHADPATGCVGAFIEPDLTELIGAMDSMAMGRRPADRFNAARARTLNRFSWRGAAAELARLTVGYQPPELTEPVDHQIPSIRTRRMVVSQREVLTVLELVRPWAMACTGKLRVGNSHDGGYVLPATALQCDAVLSIGVGSDVSFDLELADAGAAILQFDHTVDGPPTQHERFTFIKRGWGIESAGPLLSFPDILSHFAKLMPHRPLLKFDIEGAEFDVLDGLDPALLAPFEVIVCEIHDLGSLAKPGFYERVLRSFQALTRNHVPVHLHANNYREVSVVAGIPIPEVLEISFLRRDLDTFPNPSDEPIPGPLDRPNHPFKPDLWLTAF